MPRRYVRLVRDDGKRHGPLDLDFTGAKHPITRGITKLRFVDESYWTCRTHVDAVATGATLEIAPLSHLPVVRDLVVDMAPFFDKWAAAKGQFKPTVFLDNPFPNGISPVRGSSRSPDHPSGGEPCPGHDSMR